jgi:hypothetical protein
MRRLSFRLATGETFRIEVDENTCLYELKSIIERNYSVPSSGLKMILGSRVLDDSQTVKSIGIRPNSYIILHHVQPAPGLLLQASDPSSGSTELSTGSGPIQRAADPQDGDSDDLFDDLLRRSPEEIATVLNAPVEAIGADKLIRFMHLAAAHGIQPAAAIEIARDCDGDEAVFLARIGS